MEQVEKVLSSKMEHNQKIKKMSEIQIYKSADNKIELQEILENNTVWLTQKQIAFLFGTQQPMITKHLKNIFNSNKLDKYVSCSILEHTAKHGAIKEKKQTVIIQPIQKGLLSLI